MFKKLKQFCEDNKFELSDTLIHWRYGDWSISVTELLWLIVDPWFEYVKNNHTKKLQEACDRWNEVHDNAENHNSIVYREIKKNNNIYKYHKTFKQWKILHGVNILETEKTFVKQWIRGTIDALTNIWLVDYKSSRKHNIKYFLQVAWYCWLSEENNWYILYMN